VVRVRTSELRETVAELESFSYSIAHDLRAPLRSMSGFAEILLAEHSGQLNHGGKLCLNRIVRSAGVMDQLIRDVLNYGQILRANPVLEPIDMALHFQVTREYYPAFSQEGANIQIEGPFPKVLGNAALLTQIVSHLFDNSIKFTQPGKRPAVRVWSESGGRLARFYIKDSGIGIPPDQHQRIFGVFEQLDQVQDGTGIGLAIVKKAVERLGGTVGVVSEPGRGATFWFDLQIADSG
jgi:signal transduction histidine kinase